MLFLDACRDVPTGTKGGTKGLVRLGSTPKGALVVYATESGKTADDNSNFIDALIHNINKPNEQIVNVVADIADEVEKKTMEAQIPVFFYKSLPKKFVLNKVHVQETSLPKPSVRKQIQKESRTLQMCKAFSYSPRDAAGIMDKRTLMACKKVNSAIGKAFVARVLCKIGNKDEAKELFEQIKPSLLSNINADSAYLLGYLYKNILHDMQKSIEYYTKSCSLDFNIACSNASFLYQDKKQYKKAMQFAQKACTLKAGKGCARIGYLYYEGFGVQKDNKKAVKYFKQGCELDDGWGCSWLGFMYEKGNGVDADKTKALTLYEKGCSLDFNSACSNAAQIYQDRKEYKKAMQFAQKACMLKDGRGCTRIGYLYHEGFGVQKDNKKAVKYFKQGCELDNGWGCSWLGIMYRDKEGVPYNTSLRNKYFKKACKLGDSFGCKQVEKLGLDIKYSLTIYTTPANAKVYITNIKAKYTDGILLKKGTYKIKVVAKGYQTKKMKIYLDKDMKKTISLESL